MGEILTAAQFFGVIRRGWASICLIALLCSLAALAFTLLSPKVYAAEAQNFVAISNTDPGSSITNGSTFINQRVNSYGDLVTSPQVLQPVIDQLHLPESVDDLAKQVSATSPLQTVFVNVTATYADAKTAADIANAVSVQLGQTIERIETPTGAASSPVKVTLTQPARVPLVASSPKKLLNLFLGLLVGLGLGIGYIFMRETLDTSVRTAAELAEISGAPSLGVITFDDDAHDHPLIALDPKSQRAEAVRMVRTNLQFVDVDNPPRCVVITSSLPEEGKTTTACNLAITFALSGQKVCIIDGDLRRPKVADYFGIEGSIGLTNLLAGQNKLNEVFVKWNRGLVMVLPAGPVPPNPSELLGSKSMATLLEFLSTRFDVVIIDAPPLLPVTDAAILAAVSDGAVLVVRHGKTSRTEVVRAAESLRSVNAKLLGTIHNFVPLKARGYGYGYGYGYSSDLPTAPLVESNVTPFPSQMSDGSTPKPASVSKRVFWRG
jgi:capsular exopolysaccharide synthesis family protein